LDRALREELLAELRSILHRTGIPAVYVTHDQDEAFTIADRVLLLHDGKIVQQGTPAEVWSKPDSVWVAEFLGLGNVIEGNCRSQVEKSMGCEVETRLGIFDLKCAHLHHVGEKVHLLVRPRQAAGESNEIHSRVADVLFQQDGFKVRLDNGLYFYMKDEPEIGQELEIKIKLECLE
jgi:ABC-type Fe3+/spermidine/putrescine transport system ATPase subunit